MFKYWIQHTDYSSEDFDAVSESEAIQAFEQFDWNSELTKFIPEEEGKSCCSAGFGFHNDGDILLHICPRDKEWVLFHFNYPKVKRFLGILRWTGDSIHFVENYPFNRVSELIHLLYSGDYDKISDFESIDFKVGQSM